MTYYETYKAVFDQVKTVLGQVTSIKQVVVGGQFKLTNLPVAIVNPTETNIRQAVLGEMLENEISFDVVVVIRETEPSDWFNEIISVLGDVTDAILADRTLNGTVKDVIPTFFSPGEITFKQKLYYGGVVRFIAKLYYTPS